jgi:hypothetical protein
LLLTSSHYRCKLARADTIVQNDGFSVCDLDKL